MSDRQRIVVVGGGIWGLSTAYHLARRCDAEIRVLERNSETALETTPRAAGLVGQIRSSPTMCRAIQYALSLLEELGQETGGDLGLRRTGSLLVAMTPRRMAAYEQQVERARQAGVDAAFVSHEEMQRLCPAMNVSAVEGGYFVSGDGYVDPAACAKAYAAAARQRNVAIELNALATGLRMGNGKVLGVELGEKFLPADQVVVTAGPWTGLLARRAGINLAMQPIRHQRVRTAPAGGIPDHHPVVRITDVSCYVRPEQGGYLYGFFEPQPTSIELESQPPEFCTDDIPPPHETMNEARRRLKTVFPILDELEVVERHQGMTSFAPDGRYLLGPWPGIDGLFLASGCAALGIAGSAAVGKWLAGWLLDGAPDEPLDEFSLIRFGDKAADRTWVQNESEQFYGGYYSIRAAK